MYSQLRRLKAVIKNSTDAIVPFRYIDRPTKCEKTEEIISRFRGSIAYQPHSGQIEYALPQHASSEVIKFFSQFTPLTFEREYVAQLANGRVFGEGVVIAPDGKSIARDVSVDYGKPFETHYVMNGEKMRRPTRVRGVAKVIATCGGYNYYHWLFDELPRLLISREECDIIIGRSTTQYNRDALRLLGFAGDVLQPSDALHVQCDELIIPSLVGISGNPTPKHARIINAFVEPLLEGPSLFGEKLYISRAKAVARRVSNDEELWSELRDRGFRKVVLEETTWKEQINAFRGAKVIVAPHGAGLANIVFCNPGTKVVEFFSRSYMHWCFWQLAAARGLDYRPVVALSDEPLSQIMSKCGVDIAAPVGEIVRALS